MINLPEQVRRALARLEAAGHEAFVVGGAVRDCVRGAGTGTDWDITTSALPEETETIFSGYRVIEAGMKHGTVTVLLDGEPLEITTYRVDGGYSDHRHPDEVRFTRSLREDLRRRDFTMNAMAYSPRTGVVDPFGGQADLAAGVVRCVGEPDRRFQEDALRILRALRFASALGMGIHPDTARAARDNRGLLTSVAAERVRVELTKLLCGADAERVLLEFPDILSVLLPEIGAMVCFDQHNPHHDRDVWAHTAAVTAAIPAQPVLRWAALLHDVGKPPCFSLAEDGVGHFYGHAAESARMADGILRRLRFDTDSREEIVRGVAAGAGHRPAAHRAAQGGHPWAVRHLRRADRRIRRRGGGAGRNSERKGVLFPQGSGGERDRHDVHRAGGPGHRPGAERLPDRCYGGKAAQRARGPAGVCGTGEKRVKDTPGTVVSGMSFYCSFKREAFRVIPAPAWRK